MIYPTTVLKFILYIHIKSSDDRSEILRNPSLPPNRHKALSKRCVCDNGRESFRSSILIFLPRERVFIKRSPVGTHTVYKRQYLNQFKMQISRSIHTTRADNIIFHDRKFFFFLVILSVRKPRGIYFIFLSLRNFLIQTFSLGVRIVIIIFYF